MNPDDSLFEGVDLTADDDTEDLSQLDRGDKVDNEEEGDAGKNARAKDDGKDGGAGQGDGDGSAAGGKGGKNDAGKEGKDGGQGGEKKDGEKDPDGVEDPEDPELEEEEEEEEPEDGADGDKNTPARVRRAQRQRDAERARAEALQRELDAFKAGQRSAAPKEKRPTEQETINKDLEALYEQVEDARADGQAKEAAKLQREIDAKNRRLSQIENEEANARRDAAAAEDRIYNGYLDRLEAQFPELVADSDDFDPAKVQRMMRGIERGIRSGQSPSEALAEVADLMLGVDLTTPARKAKPAKPAKDDKAAKEKEDKAAKDLADKRRDKVEKANRQPADTSRRGADGAGDDTKIDVNRLSDEDYDRLPESTKAKMRGDFLS